MAEIKLFYDWLETHPLSPASIVLWHALMFIANRSGWIRELSVPVTVLEMRTGMPRSTIYREREKLRIAGRITFRSQGGRASCVYILISLECQFVSGNGTQQSSSPDFVCLTGTQSETQIVEQPQVVSRVVSHSGTTYKLNSSNVFSTEDSKQDSKERKKPAKERDTALDTEKLLSTLEPPWRELMAAWLEYKRTRRESYRSELGVKKCLSQLKHLSGSDDTTAAAIIDRSIANNWAGLFPLPANQPLVRGHPPAAGQHPGQIIQPSSEERTQQLLEKYDKK